MREKDVTARLAQIARYSDDDEKAHSLEDTLWHDVLKEIASGHCSDDCAQALAHLAVMSREIEFNRWCS